MRIALAVLGLALAPAALADATRPAQAAASVVATTSASQSHPDRVLARYCEKLREGPEAYALFVRRLSTVYGYTYSDFAPDKPGAPVKADCRAGSAKVASAPHSVAR